MEQVRTGARFDAARSAHVDAAAMRTSSVHLNIHLMLRAEVASSGLDMQSAFVLRSCKVLRRQELMMDASTLCPVQSPPSETWPSGRRHSPAKGAYGPKPVSRVQIPASPPIKQSRSKKYPIGWQSPPTNQRGPPARATRFYPCQSRASSA